VVVELRPADGGSDAESFAAALAEAFTARARRRQEAVTRHVGAARTVQLTLATTDLPAWQWLAGSHRIQRIPRNDPRGRRHTSTVTVAVLAEEPGSDERTASTPPPTPAGVRIDTFRGTGAGGQHRNKTDSAVRVTHQGTGTVVTVLQGRSQHANRRKALAELARRLDDRERARSQGRRRGERRDQVAAGAGSAAAALVAGGARDAKAFTYNDQRDQVLQHATGRTWPLTAFLRGRFEG
jgi:protein subunit release factor A